MEQKVLAAAIRSREAFVRVAPHVEHKDLSPQGGVLWDYISEFYENDKSVGGVDVELLSEVIKSSVTSDKRAETLSEILRNLSELEVSEENVIKTLLGMKARAVGMRLSAELANPQHDPSTVQGLIDSYTSIRASESVGEEKDEFKGASLHSLVKGAWDRDNLIQIAPKSLNTKLDGGVPRGTHIVVFARPESGKTLLMVNMMADFAQQGLKVLYVGNEDPTTTVLLRLVARQAGMTKHEILEDPDKAEALAREAGYDNIVLAGLAPGTFYEIRQLLDEHKPDVLVIDQLRNLAVGADNRTNQLEKAAIKARNLAKKNNIVVVSVTQAGDSANNKQVLEQGDVDNSNTGIPATADLMIGIGVNRDLAQMNRRMLSFPKNKVSGDHEPLAIEINPQLCKVRGL